MIKRIKTILNTMGILIMLIIILTAAPLTVPKLLGYHIYAVLSGSMQPAYPVGSVVYLREEVPEKIQTGDAITFYLPEEADVVMTHRVVEIDTVKQEFVTKGDANQEEDEEPVAFDRLIGKPVFCIPGIAVLSDFINTATGKAVAFSLFAFSFICWVIADLIKVKHKQKIIPKNDIDNHNSNSKEEQGVGKKASGFGMRKLLQIIFGILILLSVWGMLSVLLEYRVASNEYRALQKVVKETPSEKSDLKEELPFRPNESIVAEFQALKLQNPEMTAWIAFDTLDISYPVMQGEDNTYYLTHTFSGKTNSSGSIFMEAGNSGDFTDCHTILYGHNMKNGSMFGLLKKYRDEEFYQGNEFFTVYLEDRYYRYQIFSVHNVAVTDQAYTIGFAPNQEFADFVGKLNRQAWYDTGIVAGVNDKVVTLSTCSASDEIRYVVHAIKVNEGMIE